MTDNTHTPSTGIFGAFKANMFDFNPIVSHCSRAAETGAAILQITTSTTQEIIRQQIKILHLHAEQTLKAPKEIINNATFENIVSTQTDFVKDWFDRNLGFVHELLELGSRSIQKVLETAAQHIPEATKEFPDTAAPPSNKKKAA